ncbi:hypothetical protein PR048_004750 [Dryococelus australis]|uniref:Uncharacterized protein n=1 Tax=Dryococelus australis TaxID=614101 RepID=A0ABQ9I6B0_9NEOP|nr:hypothetical protein PR048_004750 [Dryococelus australis]
MKLAWPAKHRNRKTSQSHNHMKKTVVLLCLSKLEGFREVLEKELQAYLSRPSTSELTLEPSALTWSVPHAMPGCQKKLHFRRLTICCNLERAEASYPGTCSTCRVWKV